jgi:hypothetical protein
MNRREEMIYIHREFLDCAQNSRPVYVHDLNIRQRVCINLWVQRKETVEGCFILALGTLIRRRESYSLYPATPRPAASI